MGALHLLGAADVDAVVVHQTHSCRFTEFKVRGR
jgi:hypothetical protein